METRRWLLVFSFFLGCVPAARAEETLTLVIDADFSIARAGAEAIELGVRTALSEVDDRAGGVALELVRKDHRGNSKRSVAHLERAAADPSVLAVIGGVHSPPYITGQSVVNEARLPLLLPWSAAGPITRAPEGQENWIFRLSVDDWQAGPFMAEQMRATPECQRNALLLMDTGWGRSNRTSLLADFEAAGAEAPMVIMFAATAGETTYAEVSATLGQGEVDCLILLSHAPQGAGFVRQFNMDGHKVRIFSHWGILSGPFATLTTAAEREAMSVRVLQTCGLRAEARDRSATERALQSAAELGAVYDRLAQVPATTGFVHGYDLAHILVAAMEQAALAPEWADAPIADKRVMLRAALEALEAPVPGILRTYEAPFSAYDQTNTEAHEALGRGDLCLAAFGMDGLLTLAAE